jgi:PKD repeat protein
MINKHLSAVLRTTFAGLCLLGLPLAVSAADTAAKKPAPAQASQPSPEAVAKDFAKLKAEHKEKDKKQKEDYLRAVPPPQGAEMIDGDAVKTHSAREWYMLTYPTGTMPAMPWTRARGWVNRHVPDAAPWAGTPLRPGNGRKSLSEGLSGATMEATVAPGSNVWVPFGPQPLDSVGTTNNAYQYGIVAGRVGPGALAVDPVNPGTAYAGFTAGGLWKTTDLGLPTVTWTPLWEDKDFVTQSVGAIEIDPTDSNVLYVGTGDWAAIDQFSEGLMKSADGGLTWTQLGADIFTPYAPGLPTDGNRWSNQNVKVIQVDPKNPDNVLVGTRYDLYLSNDGGSSWQICPFGNGYTNPSVNAGATILGVNRVSGLFLDERGADTVVYMSVGYPYTNGNGNNGVYRFTWPSSGCPAWPGDFTTLFGGLPANTGNGINGDLTGGSLTGRVEMAGAIGPDNGLSLYLQVATGTTTVAEGTYVLRPDGGSTTWTKLSGSGSTAYKNCANGASDTAQDWYDLFIAVDPADDKTLYIGHIDAFKATVSSTYSSMTLANLTNVYSSGCASYGKVHPDQHAFAFVPGTNGAAFLLGNDGGVYYNDNRGDVNAWKALNDSFNTNQFYAGQIGADFAGNGMGGIQWLFGGMQDNGNSSWDSTTPDLLGTGRSVGGDGFFTSFDVLQGTETAGWWISEYTYGALYCSSTGADGPFSRGSFPRGNCGPSMTGSADWSAPFMLDTLHCTNSQCRNYVFGEDYVHAAGAYGTYGPTWARVSGSLVKTANGAIISVNMAPSNPKAAVVGTSDGKVWWSETMFTGTGCTQAAANTSSFACTPNASAVWRDADSTNLLLPNRVIGGVAFDPTDHTRIYAAVGGFNTNTPTTPGHLFEFKWNGSAWIRADKTGNLPDVPASSVAVNPHDRKQVFVGTYFGFYYTADIDAVVPVWTRYQHGLPNTVIKHLTIDRGPASNPYLGTTLAAFTYGRGVYAIKLPTTPGGFCTPPAAPTGLSASATLQGRIDLSWSGVSGATGYNVYRGGASGGPYTQIASGVTGTTHADLTVASATTYHYVVRAVKTCESANSNQASATSLGVANVPPVANFTFACTNLACAFTDASTDSDGTIASRSWSFGDGGTSTAQNPSRTYAAAGTYNVTLTVTDNNGAAGTTVKAVTVTSASVNITLSVVPYLVKNRHRVDLTWSGATTANVDVYRNGALVTTTANDGFHTDAPNGRGSATYTYRVCNAGSATACSANVNATF